MGLDILDKIRHPGDPPVQITENGEHPRNRGLKLAELCPREMYRFWADLALVREELVPLRRELASPQ